MTGNKGNAFLLVAILIGVNALGLVFSYGRRKAEAATNQLLMDLKADQGEVYSAWHDSPVVPIGTDECESKLALLATASKLPVPKAGRPISKADLDSAAVDDLDATLADFLLAYKKGRPADLIGYMVSRGETLSSAAVKRMAKHLVDNFGFSSNEIEGKSKEEIYAISWETDGTEPAFESLLPSDSGITFWEISSDARDVITNQDQFGRQDFELWRWRNLCHDNFTNPSDTIEAQVSKFGKTKVADVRLVVKHRGTGLRSICPYVVRFWYSDTREKWVPCLFTQVPTSKDIPEKMYF